MRYRIDILVFEENWAEFAATGHETYADEIARMLLKKGKTVRVTKWESIPEFGLTLRPKAPNLTETAETPA